MKKLQYKNYIFDLDSTLVTVEGIDLLGEWKGVGKQIATLTQIAMNGEGNLDNIFTTRLSLIQPTKKDLIHLGQVYCEHITPGALELVTSIFARGGQIFIVSGSYRTAVLPVALQLGIPAESIFANELLFAPDGTYRGIKEEIPLWKNHGKAEIVRRVRESFPGNTLCIGDGMSDYEASLSANGFVYFGGVVQRPRVAALCTQGVTDPDIRLIQQFI